MVNAGFTRRTVAGALLFALLIEWMRPLEMMSQSTGLYRLEPLLITIAAIIAIDVIALPSVLAWTVKTLIVLSMPALLYADGLMDFTWWPQLSHALLRDTVAIVKLDWEAISPELRTFAFVMSWAIVAACLFHAVQYRRFILWFTAGTAVYLLSLEWWLDLPVHTGILRATAAGLLLHALSVPYSLQRFLEQQPVGRRMSDKQLLEQQSLTLQPIWVPVSVGLVAVMLVAGLLMANRLDTSNTSRSIEVWSSLKPIAAWGQRFLSGNSIARTGFSEDDAHLGGSLQVDDTPLFVAASDRVYNYWRAESKAIYDGAGWRGEAQVTTATFSPPPLSDAPFTYIHWLSDFQTPLFGYPPLAVSELSAPDQAVYLQLPERLPDRVEQLATQIVAPYDSVYEKVKAIQNYLRQTYPYTLDPPMPEAPGDFVDQFLFDVQAGYCDYFSTSMAVMLRSIGIPARWVKGFAQGEPLDPYANQNQAMIASIEQRTGRQDLYYTLVRGSDAHSWVEAYIPDKGWLAFEPTPAYYDDEWQREGWASAGDEAIEAMAPILSDSSIGRRPTDWVAEFYQQVRAQMTPRLIRTVIIAAAALLALAALVRIATGQGRANNKLRLWLYICGFGGVGADARLLQRILLYSLDKKAVSKTPDNETLREAARRALAVDTTGPTIEHAALWDAVQLCEQLQYGPPRSSRLPVKQLLAITRSIDRYPYQ